MSGEGECQECATVRATGCPVVNEALKSLTDNIKALTVNVNALTEAYKSHDLQAKEGFNKVNTEVETLKECVEVNKEATVKLEGYLSTLAKNQVDQARAMRDLTVETSKFAKTVNTSAEKRELFYQRELSAWRQSDETLEATSSKERMRRYALYGTAITAVVSIVTLIFTNVNW